MDVLLSHERALIGQWIMVDGTVKGDQTCGRIERLTNGILDLIQDHPNAGGWQRLFRDGVDGRYWERYFPQIELHGGGPPALRQLTAHDVAAGYGIRD